MIAKMVKLYTNKMKRNRVDFEEIQEKLFNAIEEGDYKKVKKLIKEGVDINESNFYGKSPLLLAAERGHKKIIKYIIKAKAEVNLCDFEGNCPLSAAIIQEHYDCIKLLLKAGATLFFVNK